MTVKIITEIENGTCKHIRYFLLDLPRPLYGGYTQVMSYNAFFHSLKKRNHSPRFLYHSEDLEECWQYKLGEMKKKPPIRVGSMWQFYELIGYDHKLKKWRE